jgi:hypothetical protein
MTNSENVVRPTDPNDSLRFDGGRVYRIMPDRLRVEFGDEFWEMDFAALASRLRYERQSTDRKQFAAMAMQGLAGVYADGGSDFADYVAKLAVSHADSLLKELAK